MCCVSCGEETTGSDPVVVSHSQPAASVSFAQHAGHSCFQRRQLVLDDIPHDLAVDPEIFVNQDISKPGDLFPVDTGSALASFFGEVFCGFSDYFQISHNRIKSLVVLQEVLKREPARVRFYFLDCGENIFEVDPKVPGHRRFRVGWWSGGGA